MKRIRDLLQFNIRFVQRDRRLQSEIKSLIEVNEDLSMEY